MTSKERYVPRVTQVWITDFKSLLFVSHINPSDMKLVGSKNLIFMMYQTFISYCHFRVFKLTHILIVTSLPCR
jgi:hypothetical protein